jgi:hypothetical protein
MAKEDKGRIALGCITRYLESPDPYQDFIRNAREHGYDVDVLIIALTQTADIAVLAELNEQLPIELIELGDDHDLPEELIAVGAHPNDIDQLLDATPLEDYGMVPFCTQRNAVLLKALLLDMDWVVFFDHNMRALELVADPNAQSGRRFREVDFFGPHFDQLEHGAAVTTGGYSGYDAFPPVQMSSLRDLLHGIGREESFDVISAEGALTGLHLAPDAPLDPKPAIQAFAGNLGLDLNQAHNLPPFFSGWYHLGDDIVLARGEDTLLGAAAINANIGCVDVGTRVFLDPHDTFPEIASIDHPRMRERLYWNCLGWIARLPLLDHIRHEAGLLDWSLDELQSSRRLALSQGAGDLADLLEDNRFYDLPTFFDLSYIRLGKTIAKYESMWRSWRRIVKAVKNAKK